jgi:hypothetical protein
LKASSALAWHFILTSSLLIRLRALVWPEGLLVYAFQQWAGHETDGLSDQQQVGASFESGQTGVYFA